MHDGSVFLSFDWGTTEYSITLIVHGDLINSI